MNMSNAALPPVHGAVTEADRSHPLYPEYARHRAAMSCQLVAADGFKDWLYQRNMQARDAELQRHPRFREFQAWMQANQGGRRTKLAFPANFLAWLDGARW